MAHESVAGERHVRAAGGRLWQLLPVDWGKVQEVTNEPVHGHIKRWWFAPGASMMGPDYTHWHGMFEAAERFYVEFVPQAEHLIAKAAAEGKQKEADAVNAVLQEILSRPEHAWKSYQNPLMSGGRSGH